MRKLKKLLEFIKTMPAEIKIIITIILLLIIIIAISAILNIIKIQGDDVKHYVFTLAVILIVHLLDRGYFRNDIVKSIRSEVKPVIDDSMMLLQGSAACGLSMVYPKRDKARDDIITAIAKAEHKINVLGIVFSQTISFTDILLAIKLREAQLKRQLDVQILLLDVLRSPAVFRAFLESTPTDVTKLFNYPREELRSNDPYLESAIYKGFTEVLNLLNNQEFNRFQDYVRYYGLNPSCWMIRVDSNIFYEPYTHGRSTDNESDCLKNPLMGPLMPVFKFNNCQDVDTFRIIDNHFQKLWFTSNEDLFHMEARKADNIDKVCNIFRTRHVWLKHVYSSLYIYDEKTGQTSVRQGDKRKSPRFCEETGDLKINVLYEDVNYTFMIKNYSNKGLCLSFCESNQSSNIKEGATIKLDLKQMLNFSMSSKYAIGKLITSRPNWVVKWIEPKLNLMGIHCTEQ